MVLLLQYTLIFASVLILVPLGGCFSEHSGVINLGLEGVMIMGALGGALAMRYMPANSSAFVMIVVVLLAAALLGTVYSSLLAVACINFKADQTIVGTALNMLGTAGATVIVKAINTAANPDDVSSIIQYAGAKKAFVVNIGSFEFSWFMLVTLLLLIAAYVVLYKTRFGLRLMACGEHPQAADSVGINVYKMRWAGVLISGMLGGLGGIVFITAGVSEWRFEYGVAGFGFLALAVMIFGNWKPLNVAGGALLFLSGGPHTLRKYKAADTLPLGGLTLRVLETPGHSEGSVCLLVEGQGVLLAGDTLFRCSCGRCDFPGGDYRKMLASLGRLAALEGNLRVLPGHDRETTLDYERRVNPYMRQGAAR